MQNRKILLGITGGIAAYKSAIIASKLKKLGYDIYVVMTENATKIISPIVFETLTGNKVYVEMFKQIDYTEVEHIELAKKVDLIVVAPATYNIIGKIANGIADDMLTTVISAFKKDKFFALAMNTNMYENPILQENIVKLKNNGYKFIDATSGELACKTIGKGRMAEPEDIVIKIENYFNKKDILKGKKVLITAGRTEEAIDPIRYMSNRSTGKMGYSLAKAAKLYGADVTLISGPTNLKKIDGIKTINIKTANEMYEETLKKYDNMDLVIMSAAVADYKVKEYSNEKIKKQDDDLTLKLTRNPDILFELGKMKKNQYLVGFAAESSNLIKNSLGKLKRKNLDMIIANNVSGFSSDENKAYIILDENKIIELETMQKNELAFKILDKIIEYKINL
ncbi:bifunctional phosphopantothenoylcysteine decarboxylase/phosphopantothenate--cysteine ligase CoaBC [Haliovirga abyssi]|uniref:Coenzyme A biosynthesis bifunctional protein CoaBC n=1 Tax=Haliovirga abyssi TaxID=2996794 RepID=A0AAU9DMM6_9FUSO|nr:bifunctional phosphopantothenoylcysteine decarboxylase/phosphopantothenate--cysteine ligase CoaBC [Haliovirga abyssi]BDU51282.1 peptidase ClpP [Haliovirga abyssi]